MGFGMSDVAMHLTHSVAPATLDGGGEVAPPMRSTACICVFLLFEFLVLSRRWRCDSEAFDGQR